MRGSSFAGRMCSSRRLTRGWTDVLVDVANAPGPKCDSGSTEYESRHKLKCPVIRPATVGGSALSASYSVQENDNPCQIFTPFLIHTSAS